MMDMSKKNGFVPHIYLHPYEFGISEQLKVPKNELINLGKKRAFYWSLRQNQWLNFRNETLKFKLQNLFSNHCLEGTLHNLSLLID